MKAKLILGRAGAGKTSRCLDEIAENIEGGYKKPLLLLVPNQFSLEMEKKLVLKTGGKGMDLAQVLSFERFSYRVFSQYGRPGKKTLDETGKLALLRKITYDNRDRLQYYSGAHGKEGFISQLGSLISEFYKYGIDTEKLETVKKSEDFSNTPLALKLNDLSLILNKFSEYISEEYITIEQNLDLLAEILHKAVYFHGSKIWLDGFFRFTEQDYRVIGKLAEICGELTVSLTMPETSDIYERPHGYDMFFETKTTALRITEILNCCGCDEITTERLVKKGGYGYAKPLTHLEKEYFNFSQDKYKGPNNGVIITKIGNIYNEAACVASQIAALVRRENVRYKDIAVCACDLEAYEHVLRDAFSKYGIPYFIDMSRKIYNKRLVEMLRSLIDTGVSGWGAENVIRLLRTGLFDFTTGEIDILENYILEYGMKGYKWNLEWKNGGKNFDLEKINGIRSRVFNVVSSFLDIFKGKNNPTVKTVCAAVFDFIDRNGVTEKLLSLEKNKKEAIQVWNIVVSVFDKLVEILGGEEADIKSFSQILEGALSGATEGFIPPTADAVIAGDIKRTRLPEIKALFVLGLNDGVLPSVKSPEGLFSDADRIFLAERGAQLAPHGVRQVLEEQFLVYCALTKPKEYLNLSWPAMGFEDEELKKSMIVEKIESIFPDAVRTAAPEPAYSKGALLSEIAVKIGELKRGNDISGSWADGVKWAVDNGYGEIMADGAFASRRSVRLSKASAKRFVKKDIYSSVTRIEKYIKCPFSYFAEYGLKASERTVYGFRPVDMGNIYHDALDNMSRELESNGLSWGRLESAEADALIESSVERACAGLDVLESSEKNKYLVSRLKRIMKRAVWALNYHAATGSFTPFEYETGFGTEKGLLPPITVELSEGHRFVFSGRIDRVDVYDKDGARYVKIIDYKSGNRNFNLQEVYYGLQLQLMLYMDAYLKSGENSFPAGIFYFRITDPIIDDPGVDGDESAVIDGILSQLKMSGLVVNDYDIINALHNGLNGASNIIPVKLKKPAKNLAPEPDAYSSVVTMEQFYMLMKRAADVVREAGNRLVSGDIEASPVKGVGTTPCVYCGFSTLCGFDVNNGYRYRNLKKLKNGEVLELLNDE